MWHETPNEMKILLKSVMDMDEHSSSSDSRGHYLYDWELHIFFDDAFTKKNGKYCVNDFVLGLFLAMNEVHAEKYKPEPVAEVETTEYGGRVTWTLTHKSKVICHLKDKLKIRIKKRWSQCMYIDYFWQKYRPRNITEQLTEAHSNQPIRIRDFKSEDTFILALDGDMDFKPEAVVMLLEVMMKNDRIGAACGRIHPTGSGIIAGYQKFEYAVGHWLQKSTEDALGNVLCSPGCFSLFRLEALCKKSPIMENVRNRMKIKSEDWEKTHSRMYDLDKTPLEKYFTMSTTGRHSIQYDQGEDRWLCTLLITRGWEVSIS